MNHITKIAPIPSRKATNRELLLAMLADMGCGVSGVSGIEDGDSYSGDWEWFDPFKVTDLDDLPDHWRAIVKNQNSECWREGFRYVHAPMPILCEYPRVPVKGIFVVTRRTATPEDVNVEDLIHTGGQFIEYDTENKGIWRDWLEGVVAS